MSGSGKHEQSELMALALESVNSEELAMQLIEGNLQDAWLLRVVIDIESRYGVMFVLFSIIKMEIILIYSLFGTSSYLKRIKAFEADEEFANDMIQASEKSGIEPVLSERMARTLYKSLDKKTIPVILASLDKNNTESVQEVFQKFFNSELRLLSTKVEIKAEKISSISFRTRNSIATSEVIKPYLNPYNETVKSKTSAKIEALEQEESKKDPLTIIQEIQQKNGLTKVVECSTVLSPVAGLSFEDLNDTMKLQLMLPVSTEEQIEFAKLMGALDGNGVNHPITADFLGVVRGNENEYYVLAKGPGGILLKAFEERPVKVAIAGKKKYEEKGEKDIGGILWIFIVILVVFLFIIFKLFIT